MLEIVLVMGYPASGKSTFATQFKDKGYSILSRDQNGGNVVDLLPQLKTAIQSGKSVVLDNTFPTKDSRKPFIDQAKKLKVPIRCLWLNTTIEQAQFNACMRIVKRCNASPTCLDTYLQDKHHHMFPPAVLFRYRKQLETPTKAEGFSDVEQVELQFDLGSEYCNEALIFDFDGTLRITTSGLLYPSNPEDVQLMPNRHLLKKMAKNKLILGASNQSGIHKGVVTEQQVRNCFDQTVKLLGLKQMDYQFCPHQSSPISCWCRKPMPGMAVLFIEKYKLNPKKCIVVGDMTTDQTFARRSGMQFVWAHDFFRIET